MVTNWRNVVLVWKQEKLPADIDGQNWKSSSGTGSPPILLKKRILSDNPKSNIFISFNKSFFLFLGLVLGHDRLPADDSSLADSLLILVCVV